MRVPFASGPRPGPGWLLALGFLLMFSVYEGGRVLHTRPAPCHLWRQTDCLSITENYRTGRPFLEPEIHARIADDGYSGNSAGEFPLLYWAVGQVWKVTGPSEFVYRLFGILLHFAATWALYLALRRVLDDAFWAVASALLLFASPIIVYYSMGFLTDVPALDLVLIGWYFVVRHAQERRVRWWALAMCAFALAALLKVSAGISLVAILAILLAATLMPSRFAEHRKLLPAARPAWTWAVLSVVAVLAWYAYAEGYNDGHNGRYTFNSIWPIWDMTPEEVHRAWTFGTRILVFQVFDTTVWLVLGAALVALAVQVRRLPGPVALLNILMLAGVLAYTLLWFHAVDGHDYYFINPLILPLVLWTTFLWWLRRDHSAVFGSIRTKSVFTLLLVYNVAYAANNMRMRYAERMPIDPSEVLPIHHRHELPFWSAMDHYDLRGTLDLGPVLDSLHIPKDALVIFLDDHTINGSLYLMGRKGFTNYGHDWSDPGTFERLHERGARYLLFAQDRWLDDPVVKPYLTRPLGRHKGIHIHALSSMARAERM